MKLAAALPYSGSRVIANLAHIAEDNGWDGIFIGDAIWCEDPMISLAAAAMTTSQIRLGPMVIPVPLRHPWKLASEAVALDRLSNGRLTLGLGAGAVWMGWHAFPDVPVDKKIRAGMLDETIDILDLLFQCKPFDYDGEYYHLRLTQLDEIYYPPRPVQQPRIPIWVPGIWPRMKSMQRILKCDGLLPQKMSQTGEIGPVTLDDLLQMKTYVEANRSPATPFDIVAEGKTGSIAPGQVKDELHKWQEAGATWWVESLWDATEEQAANRLRQAPPKVD